MRRTAVLTALVAVLGLVAPPARAEEPHLRFVHALRQQGMPDLALDYLQRLSAKPPAGLAAVLPLEIAKARLDLAAQEGSPKKRDAQFAAARAAYESFLKDHPNHPLAADARLDLARMVALEGKLLLAQARRQEAPAARRDLVARARPLFGEAAKRLKEAAAQIDAKLKTLANAASDEDKAAKAALTQAKLQAQLDEGINLINQANTVLDTKEVKQRAAILDQSRAVLTALAKQDPDNPLCWQAKLWLGRLADETDNTPEARKLYEALAAEKNPAAEEAARAASYLLLRLQAREEQVPNRPAHVQQVVNGCEEWLKRHRAAVNAPEGQGVRFVLANLLEEQAQAGVTRPPNSPPRVAAAVRPLLVRAERLYKELADADGEFTEKARQRRAGVLVLLMGNRAGDISRLTNFEECYLAAQVEAYELTQGKLAPPERARRFARIVAALQRALALASRGDPPRDLADARVMLTYAYLAGGDPYAAAVLGEHLGRSNLAGARGADATAYALQAYAAIIALDRQRSASDDELKTDQRRLRQLAATMEKTWPDEPATDVARHQLGSFLLDDGNFSEAIAMLARIASSYAGLAQARYEEGAAAQKAQAAAVKLPPARKKALLRQAIADLEKVPDPVADASEESTIAACLARLQLGNLLLLDEQPNGRNYERAEALGRTLAELAPKLTLDDKLAPQVAVEAAKLRRAGTAGRAYLLLKADKPGEARKLLDPLVAQVKAELSTKAPHSDEPWYEPYSEVQRQVLLLALRAAILEDRPAASHEALALLRQASAADGPDSANDRLLRLVIDLKREADALKAPGAAGKRDKLEKGLAAFVDELAKPKDLTPDVRLFLAQAYAGLGRHDRAAALYRDFPTPDANNAEAVKRSQAVRVLLMRELRLAKEFPQALAVLNDALKSWGKNNLDVQREKVLLLEDAGNLAGAHRACREMQEALKKAWTDYERAVRAERAADEAERAAKTDDERRKAQEARTAAQAQKDAARPLRDAYWEFYFYEIRVVLKNDLKRAKDESDKERRLGALAQAIKKLEDGQEDFGGGNLRQRYQELVEGEPLLRKKYVEAQGRRLLPTGQEK